MGLTQQGGEDGGCGVLVRLGQQGGVELVQLRHLGPQCLQAEGRWEAGSEAAEARLGVEGRGWCLTS